MHLNSLRTPVLASLSFGSLLLSAAAQQVAAGKPAPGSGAQVAPAPDANSEGLPAFLLLVPGGQVQLGIESKKLIDAACQVVNPAKPEMAPKISAAKVTDAIRRSLSVIGSKKVDVAPFFLAKWPVKNAEYKTYLDNRRAAGAKMRPPFIWWRLGAIDDYNAKLTEINAEFPKQKDGPILYWERHGADLPFALKDDKGKPIDELPVTYVSWREANEFAGWLGMRLPTEAEWTRAARGDSTITWPTSTPADPASDKFSEALLKQLGIYNSRDQVPKPTGTVQGAAGPYGHVDMFGQVWQLIGDLGYQPIHGADVFSEQWKDLQKDKVGALVQGAPTWKEDRVIGKGGSYLSTGEPIQLLVDARAPVLTVDVMESLGFRLAKSLRPGYDMLYSLLRGGYNKNPFAIEQEPDMTAQIGAERYELGANGFPTSYHAVTFAPVNWLSNEKNPELAKLLDKSQQAPMLIGTLAITAALSDPALPTGIYSVLFRHHGVPKELTEAIKVGHKELIAAQKAAKDTKKDDGKDDKDKPKADDKKDDKKKAQKGSWRDMVARFGLTDEDLLSKDAADGSLKFVRVNGLQVPTEHDCYLFYGGPENKVIAALPNKANPPVVAPAANQTLVIEADAKGKAVVKLQVAPPIVHGTKKFAEFHMHLQLDVPAPAADKPWRQPK